MELIIWVIFILIVCFGVAFIIWIRRKPHKYAKYEGKQIRVNEDHRTLDEEDQKKMENSKQQALVIINQHLSSYLENRPSPKYEDWIAKLHPDNVNTDGVVDKRLYLPNSDHRNVWNDSVDRQYHV